MTTTPAPLSVFLLRHAETAYNAAGNRIGGRSPQLPLSENGQAQASACALRLHEQGLHFDGIFCSTAVRTRETLRILLETCPSLCTSAPVFTDALQELSQGAWEGRLRSEIYTPERLAEINSNNWLFKAPGGESQREVEMRMLSFLQETAAHHPSGNYLIIGHGCTFKCLLRGILGTPPADTYKMKIANCELIHLVLLSEKGWTLELPTRFF